MSTKFFAAVLAAALLFTLTACGNDQADYTFNEDRTPPQQTAQPEAADAPAEDAPADEPAPTDEPAPSGETAPEDASGAAPEDAWKVEFEKSLLENYGVKPHHYESLGDGIYQVYVDIGGRIVPYVTVDSATGDYHG